MVEIGSTTAVDFRAHLRTNPPPRRSRSLTSNKRSGKRTHGRPVPDRGQPPANYGAFSKRDSGTVLDQKEAFPPHSKTVGRLPGRKAPVQTLSGAQINAKRLWPPPGAIADRHAVPPIVGPSTSRTRFEAGGRFRWRVGEGVGETARTRRSRSHGRDSRAVILHLKGRSKDPDERHGFRRWSIAYPERDSEHALQTPPQKSADAGRRPHKPLKRDGASIAMTRGARSPTTPSRQALYVEWHVLAVVLEGRAGRAAFSQMVAKHRLQRRAQAHETASPSAHQHLLAQQTAYGRCVSSVGRGREWNRLWRVRIRRRGGSGRRFIAR